MRRTLRWKTGPLFRMWSIRLIDGSYLRRLSAGRTRAFRKTLIQSYPIHHYSRRGRPYNPSPQGLDCHLLVLGTPRTDRPDWGLWADGRVSYHPVAKAGLGTAAAVQAGRPMLISAAVGVDSGPAAGPRLVPHGRLIVDRQYRWDRIVRGVGLGPQPEVTRNAGF